MSRGMKRLLLIWAVFAALAAIIYVNERERSSTVEVSSRHDPKWLLPIPYAELGALEIMHRNGLHRFERGSDGQWFYHGVHGADTGDHDHRADPALAASIGEAMAMFSRAQREQSMPLQDGGEEYGVVRPELLILAYRPQGAEPVLRLAVGSVTPDGYARYVLQVGANEAVTIPNYHVTNLLTLIDAAGKVIAPVAGQ